MVLAILGLVAAGYGYEPQITEFLQASFHDATFRAVVVSANQVELRKVNKDFGQSYRFDYTDITIKEPFHLLLESKVGDSPVRYVLNGCIRVMRAPRARIKLSEDLSNAPGKRQTAFDFGLLTPALFEDLYEASFVRKDRATGDLVFDVFYLNPVDRSRSRIWVDPERHIIDKREWYDQGDQLKAVFSYEAPKRVHGVWLPTSVTVRNADGVVAGVTRYQSINVNTGVSDSVFR